MRIRPGEVRLLKTGDFGLVLEVHDDWVLMAPGIANPRAKAAGRCIDFNGVRFALDYAVSISEALLSEKLSSNPRILYSRSRVGNGAPKDFRRYEDRWNVLSHIDTQEDVDLMVRGR